MFKLARRRVSIRIMVATVVIAVFLGFYGISKFTDFAQPVLCHFQLQSPHNQFIEGQFHIGTDWTEFELKKPLKPSANLNDLSLMVRPSYATLDVTDNSEGGVKGLEVSRFRLKPTDKEVWLDVRLIDDQGRSIRLYPVATNAVHSGGVLPQNSELLYSGLSYSLTNRAWNKAYFPEAARFPKIQIRASQPFKLDAIQWFAEYHYYQPCKTYVDVPEERIFNFDVPQPPLTRPEIPGWPQKGS